MPKGYREYGEELDYLSIRVFPEQKKKLRKLYGKNTGRVVRERIRKFNVYKRVFGFDKS
jgi:hypothetical protein